MNIQLFLEGQEVELNNGVSIPLNKTYSSLLNPTDIIVEYSKSINIPMTSHNNKIFGSLFKVDRIVLSGGNDNIGMYLDPNKKIKALLIYNGDVVLEGYAKYVSSEYSSSGRFFVINVFGVLGDVFYKLKQCVADANLTDDPNYVLNDHCTGLPIDRYFVKNSWYNEYPITDINNARIEDIDIIGFAPTYRGYYPNFHSDNLEQNGKFQPMTDYLDWLWKDRYARQRYNKSYNSLNDEQKKIVDDYVKALDSKGVIGSGMKDYQIEEYRSYHQRPYFYFNKLMQMFQEKCPTLTGYSLSLDTSWFNSNNPYWTRMCYMCDYDTETQEREEWVATNEYQFFGFEPYSGSGTEYFGFATPHTMYEKDGTTVYTSPTYLMSETKLTLRHCNVCASSIYYDSHYTYLGIQNADVNPQFTLNPHTVYLVYYYPDALGDQQTYEIYWSCPEENKSDVVSQSIPGVTLNPDNYLPMTIINNQSYISNIYTYTSQDTFYNLADVVISFPPKIGKSNNVPDYAESYCGWQVRAVNTVENYIAKTVVPDFTYTGGGQQMPITGWNSNYTTPNNVVSNPASSRVSGSIRTYFPISIVESSNNLTCKLSTIYKEEKPLFDIVLQYTKMFGLLWDIDYENKTINVVPRGKYFTDYTTTDWTDKLDKSKGYSISPVIFPNKYINFNYEDVEGYKYTKYSDKYNANYGAKKVKTSYEFNTHDNDLFTDIKPSMTSNRTFIPYRNLVNWDLISTIQSYTDTLERIECANEEDTQSAYTNNWFIRGYNVLRNATITDDSPLQTGNDFYCYYGSFGTSDYSLDTAQMPVFTAAFENGDQKFGALFNTPLEDYTTDHHYDNCNGSYIYDKYWNHYINERYNVQNKKLTAFFKLTPPDYIQLKFNQFVTVENQLFIVNKVFDYDINHNSPVKVELIQITDIDGYADMSGLFEGFYVEPQGINLDGAAATASGSTYIYVHSDDPVFADQPVHIHKPDAVTVTLNNYGTDPSGITTYQISWSGLGTTDYYEGYINVTSGGQSLRVPILIDRRIEYYLTINYSPEFATVTCDPIS